MLLLIYGYEFRVMKYKNNFSQHYADLLEGEYDRVDRIVLNAYYPKLLSGGGLRDWWRPLQGSDEGLNTPVLMRMAGVMSQRVQALVQEKQYSFYALSNRRTQT